MFWASHQEHHRFTLHPPDDLEVVLPQKLTLRSFLQNALINPWDFYYRFRLNFLAALGKVEGQWSTYLFPESNVTGRRNLAAFGRFLLIGQAVIVLVSLYFGWWMVPVVVTLAPFYGGWLQYLCNNTQHAGLMDNNPDYRLCTRTIYLHPFVQFLYWHMNYHIEHHMFAAVPCYKLGRLHAAIKEDLPPTQGLVGAWKEIIAILKKQKEDPKYQYMAKLPVRTA
jgi:fatty acid desaturase